MKLKREAFTLVEVVMAMTVFVAVAFAIFSNQSKSLKFILKQDEESPRIFLIKEILYKKNFELKDGSDSEGSFFKKESFKKKIEFPEMEINFYQESISKKSSFGEYSKYLNRMFCRGEWKDAFYNDREKNVANLTLMMFGLAAQKE